MNDRVEVAETPAERRRWHRVYALVVVYTVLTIVGLWLFSRAYSPTLPE
jgi:hypothetical protein